jgi:hypothetical protein
MESAVIGRVAVFGAVLALAVPAAAIIVGGGGSKSSDCLVVLDAPANYPSEAPKQVRCTDGNSNCDTDGDVNGVCNVAVKVCVNSTFSAECSLNGVAQINVEHSFDDGTDTKFDPSFLALRQRIEQDFLLPVGGVDACTSAVTISVPIKGPLGNNHCGRKKKKLALRSVSTGASGSVPDNDTLKIFCEPAETNGCDPQTLFDGTLDRIQHQIFTQSCALGNCHDSETQQAGLLLETGASYDNLVNQIPSTVPAANAGWLLVDVVPEVSGNPETSFLFHKIEGSLPDTTYGERMPRGKAKLTSSLREIIRLWIEAGAPKNPTWVPGTF